MPRTAIDPQTPPNGNPARRRWVKVKGWPGVYSDHGPNKDGSVTVYGPFTRVRGEDGVRMLCTPRARYRCPMANRVTAL